MLLSVEPSLQPQSNIFIKDLNLGQNLWKGRGLDKFSLKYSNDLGPLKFQGYINIFQYPPK